MYLPTIPLVCFDVTHDPIAKIERSLRVSIANIDQNDDPNLRYVAKSLQHSGFARTFRKYLDNHDKRMIVEHVLYENGIGLLDDIDSYLEII
ncbi:2878_t:CDS:2 [Entrophospora sp. SA101]|nr:2878_t:CDS:2 [Entrophospora sp. SA101]